MNSVLSKLLSASAVLPATLLALSPAALAQSSEYAPATSATSSGLQINGYGDIGFAVAQGDGTSFAPGDARIPADYGTDPFATAVNSRGDVASTNSNGRFVNGFLPRSMNMGGQPSFMVNVLDVDLKYTPSVAPVLLFSRFQLLPRWDSTNGNNTRVIVEQAFARIVPFASQELAFSIGKFDSVFGIEYLQNESNLRTNITPSLIARYTTGQSVGLKGFYRIQIPSAWSAISLNASATNGGSLVETLSPPDTSIVGRPIVSARLGYELNLPKVEMKLGSSGEYGPRNDQHGVRVHEWLLGADFRLVLYGLSLEVEGVSIYQDSGGADKANGLPLAETLVSGFRARGAYGTLSYALPLTEGAFRKLTPYLRYEQRHAQFEGFPAYTVDRLTAGFRVDVWDELILKAEALINGERSGLPQVDNNVFTSSFVYSF
jgi:hypothetical protein